MELKKNKKSIELVLETIVVFILLLIVFLVVVIFFGTHFTMGIHHIFTQGNTAINSSYKGLK